MNGARQNLGFIGVGTMGAPMAARLVGGGHDVLVYDVDPGRVQRLVERGARAALTVPEVGSESAVVFVSLPTGEAVETVVLDASSGLLGSMRPGATLVDLSTNSRQLTLRVAEALGERGIAAVDAPVSSISGPADAGKLTVMIGGHATAVEGVRPLLELIGTNLVHLGPPGAGTVAKLMTQYLGLTAMVADMEAILVAVKSGVDVERMLDLVPASIGANFMFRALPALATEHDFGEPGKINGLAEIMGKDIGYADALATDLGVPHPVGGAAAEVFAEALRQGFGPYHFTRVVEILEQGADAQLRIPGHLKAADVQKAPEIKKEGQ
jgi:3-hydroxyisobutyrate dehydrogenase-like beta-hydroxyacid dehydrogenase